MKRITQKPVIEAPAAPVVITRDEWAEAFRAALAAAPAPATGDPGLSRDELVDALGVSRAQMAVLLRKWHRAGRLIAGHQFRMGHGIDGRACSVPVYRLK